MPLGWWNPWNYNLSLNSSNHLSKVPPPPPNLSKSWTDPSAPSATTSIIRTLRQHLTIFHMANQTSRNYPNLSWSSSSTPVTTVTGTIWTTTNGMAYSCCAMNYQRFDIKNVLLCTRDWVARWLWSCIFRSCKYKRGFLMMCATLCCDVKTRTE